MFDLITSRDSNVKNDVLSGITVALALVPEAVAFAFVAGVEPSFQERDELPSVIGITALSKSSI